MTIKGRSQFDGTSNAGNTWGGRGTSASTRIIARAALWRRAEAEASSRTAALILHRELCDLLGVGVDSLDADRDLALREEIEWDRLRSLRGAA